MSIQELKATSPSVNQHLSRRGTISYAASVDHFSSENTGWVREPTIDAALRKMLPTEVFSSILYWEFCIVTKKLNPSPDFRYIILTEDMLFAFALGMKRIPKKTVFIKDIIDVSIHNEGLFWMDETSKRRAKKFVIKFRSEEKLGERVYEFLTYRTNGDMMLQVINNARQSFVASTHLPKGIQSKEELKKIKKEKKEKSGRKTGPSAEAHDDEPTTPQSPMAHRSPSARSVVSFRGVSDNESRADLQSPTRSLVSQFSMASTLSKAQQRKMEKRQADRQHALFDQLKDELLSCTLVDLERKVDLMEELCLAVKNSSILKKFFLTSEALVTFIFDELVYYRIPRKTGDLVLDEETNQRMKYPRDDEVEYILVIMETLHAVIFDSNSVRQRLVLFLMPKPRSFAALVRNVFAPVRYGEDVNTKEDAIKLQQTQILEAQVQLITDFEKLAQQAEHEHFSHRSTAELVKEIEHIREFRNEQFCNIVSNMSRHLLAVVDCPDGVYMEESGGKLMVHLHAILLLMRGSDFFKNHMIECHKEELKYYLSNDEILAKLKEKGDQTNAFQIIESRKSINDILKIWGPSSSGW